MRVRKWLAVVAWGACLVVASGGEVGAQRAACEAGQVRSRGHCCAEGQQWIAARGACGVVLADRCPPGTTRADATTCCTRPRGGAAPSCLTRAASTPDLGITSCPPGMIDAWDTRTHGPWCMPVPIDRVATLSCGAHTPSVTVRFAVDGPTTATGDALVTYRGTDAPLRGRWGIWGADPSGQPILLVRTPSEAWQIPITFDPAHTRIAGAHRLAAGGEDVTCSGTLDVPAPATAAACPGGAIPRASGGCWPSLAGRTLAGECASLGAWHLPLGADGHAVLRYDDDPPGEHLDVLWSVHEADGGAGVVVAFEGEPSNGWPSLGWRLEGAGTELGTTLAGPEPASRSGRCTARIEGAAPPATTAAVSPPPPVPAPPPVAIAPPPTTTAPAPPSASGATLAETNDWIRAHMVGRGFLVANLRPGVAYPDVEAFAITSATFDGCNVTIERTSLYASLFFVPSVGNRWQVDHAWNDRMTFSWGALVPGSVASRPEWTPAGAGTVSYVVAQARGASVSFHSLGATPAWLPPAVRGMSHATVSSPEGLATSLDGWFAAPRADGTRSDVNLVFEGGDAGWQTRAVEAVRHAIELCGGHADAF